MTISSKPVYYKSDFVCPKCEGKLVIHPNGDWLAFKCSDTKCNFERVINMDDDSDL
ncbi:hypothetical protein [Bacillus cytotoxicus]|uniref:hypothetical protein n=1 Tax=Bacillus cytotoxicus TaxID=580165 RepID=UPI00244AB011|nr:hypothetical protein [Bacillus cytotoxicus]MDH2862552.1 hypothetical protein [Bacillus cytotoxicus]